MKLITSVRLTLILIFISISSASHIAHRHDCIQNSPCCTNNFVLVKVQLWIDGMEKNEMIGLGAQFGKTLVAQKRNANKSKYVLSDPTDGCSQHKNQLSQEIVLVHRGNCDFTTKAKLAQDAGASAVLVKNKKPELFKMGCNDSETALQIHIPTVIILQDDGRILEEHLKGNLSVELQLYSPEHPFIDVAEFVLWLLAIGTIICASYWSAWSAREASIELGKLLDGSDDYVIDDKISSGVVDINTSGAVLFIIFATCFLIFLYKCMNNVIIMGLVVLFCIGGIEGLQICLVAVLYRWFRKAGDSFINLPYFGPISHLTLGVSPLCVVFAVVWAAKRDISFAWIGQDILGIALMITVLQIVRVPNLKVGCVLLGCAFLYDIFWVFNKKVFKESVMIVVAQRGTTSADGIPMLLKIPHMNDPWGGFSVVGFGDIILPGLVIAFSLRYDWLSNKKFRAGYFVWAMIAYGSGLLLTFVVLTVTEERGGHGQPALLYIVPLTLGSLLILGKMRGEFEILWERGEPYRACPHMHHQHSEEMCGNEGCENMKLE